MLVGYKIKFQDTIKSYSRFTVHSYLANHGSRGKQPVNTRSTQNVWQITRKSQLAETPYAPLSFDRG